MERRWPAWPGGGFESGEGDGRGMRSPWLKGERAVSTCRNWFLCMGKTVVLAVALAGLGVLLSSL